MNAMNTLKIKLSYEYIAQICILYWRDLDFLINNEYLDERAAVEHALYIIDEDNLITNPEIMDLICLGNGKSIYPYIDKLVDKEKTQEYLVKDKVIFLILNWVYDNKANFKDPLGVIEVIYADFDYPKEIRHLIRYASVPSYMKYATSELGIEKIYENWEIYLEEQKDFYSIP